MSVKSQQFPRTATAETVSAGLDLSGFVSIVTGANAGLGKETARVLALRGSTVILACRDLDRGAAAADELRSSIAAGAKSSSRPDIDEGAGSSATDGAAKQQPIDARIEVMALDLSSLGSVRDFATLFRSKYSSLNILVNNAGMMTMTKSKTADGYEQTLAVNYLGHFLLSTLLVPSLKAAKPLARIVNVASVLHRQKHIDLSDMNLDQVKRFKGFDAYGRAKLCQIMFANELHKRLQADPETKHILSVSLHPGFIQTELFRESNPIFRNFWLMISKPWMKTIAQGAAGAVFCATHSSVRGSKYYVNFQVEEPKSPDATDSELCKRLWVWSEEAVKAYLPPSQKTESAE